MNTSQTGFYLDSQSLNGLRLRAQDDQRAALREVAGQFEALFVQMMLQSMRDATPGEDLFGSEQSDYYREMLDKQTAADISARGGIGLADLLVRQLDASIPQSPRRAPAAGLAAAARPAEPVATAAAPATQAGAEPEWRTPDQFVAALLPHAERAAQRLGVDPRVLVAQSALETGWGRKVAQHADGRSSYALFGIKADSRWSGDKVAVSTLEFEGDRFERRNAAFRAYDSVAAAMDDYVDFLSQSPRYRQALTHVGDARRFVNELQQAGYATDPNYADKIWRIHQGESLNSVTDPAAQAADPDMDTAKGA